jgi:membrane-bound ClpP family serine protease
MVVIIAVAATGTLLLILTFVLWLNKRGRDLSIVSGTLGYASTKLDPSGMILIGGELWNAQSITGNAIERGVGIRVVRASAHTLVVEALDAASAFPEVS